MNINRKNIKKLKRRELLEVMLDMQSEIDDLKKLNSSLLSKLEMRDLDIESAGSIAEASLKINKVFEAAQQAADMYLHNIKNKQSDTDIRNLNILK
ncbi:MAG: DNA repair protein [Oscillospiraceae bacterium]|nr:DNA repair protein [Oscillospiraceae bacterium]